MAQELGWVNERLEPLITVQFISGASISCIVDTGFDGMLMLPQKFVAESGFSVVGWQGFHGVGQAKPYRVPYAIAGINWLGDEFDAEILITSLGYALVGAILLLDTRLTIDYAAATVVIEKVR